MSPHSAKEMASLLGRVGGRDILGISTSLFMNLLTDGLILGAPFSDTSDANASSFSLVPWREEELGSPSKEGCIVWVA